MDHPINWKDSYFYSKDRIVLTNEQIPVPGVRVLAHHLMTHAISPLSEHYHENSFEFTMIYDGVFTFQTQKEKYKLTGGDVFVAYPNEIHSTSSFPLSHGEFYWFQLDISSPESFLFLEENTARDLISRLRNLNRHIIKVQRSEMRLIKSAFQLSLNMANPSLIASYLVLFLNCLASLPAKERELSSEIYRSLNYIFDHIYSELPLEALAKYSNLSLPQFKLRFKQEMGISPRSFINMQKIEIAKTLLLEGMGKTETALQLGFNTSSYFSAVFKKYSFCTPSEYVKRNQADSSPVSVSAPTDSN